MPRPEDCLYTREHEWVHLEGAVALVGITDFAQKELGDIVYVNMGETGRSVTVGQAVGEIESVKAVAEVYAPISGQVVEINPVLGETPEKLNSDPLGDGWLIRMSVKDPAEAKTLMNFAAYQAYVEEAGH